MPPATNRTPKVMPGRVVDLGGERPPQLEHAIDHHGDEDHHRYVGPQEEPALLVDACIASGPEPVEFGDDHRAHRARSDLFGALAPDVGGAHAPVEHGRDRPLEEVGLGDPIRRNSGAPWRRTRASRSGWRCPCRRCPAPSRAPARRAPGAFRSSRRARRARPTAACRASRSASPRRRTACRRRGCR